MKDFAVDFRVGAGLSAQAYRFLIGTGFAFPPLRATQDHRSTEFIPEGIS